MKYNYSIDGLFGGMLDIIIVTFGAPQLHQFYQDKPMIIIGLLFDMFKISN